MRVPKVFLKCRVAAIIAVGLMILGTILSEPEIRAWSLLVALYAASLGIWFSIKQATSAVKAYVHRWTLETWEHGFKQGVDVGREMEAAERFIASARNTD